MKKLAQLFFFIYIFLIVNTLLKPVFGSLFLKIYCLKSCHTFLLTTLFDICYNFDYYSSNLIFLTFSMVHNTSLLKYCCCSFNSPFSSHLTLAPGVVGKSPVSTLKSNKIIIISFLIIYLVYVA